HSVSFVPNFLGESTFFRWFFKPIAEKNGYDIINKGLYDNKSLLKRGCFYMKRYNIFVISLFFSLAVILAACGGDDSEADKEEDEDVVEAEEDEQEEEEEEEEEEDEEENEDKPEEVEEGDIFNPAIAEETEGDVELIYTNDDAGYEHD